ncbi:MAG: ABC transporter ATP-binding protein [Thermoleophilia bacterium]|nr:ABC transporter ATP-binding protein [Thermoleophilia bacterium]
MITINALTKRFGKATVLDGVTLKIPRAQSVAFWGPNGAGKSTLLRCILGLYRFEGAVAVGGHEARTKAARALIGYVPQETGFYDDLRAGEALRYFATLKGVRVESVDRALQTVGLPGQAGKRIRELSGGMKQRLALAVAMLGDPPVLVLDEVTAGLDACGRQEFIALLARLSGAGRTLLFASHRLDEITTLASRVVVLERGRIASDRPVHDFAQAHEPDTTLHLTIPIHDRAQALRSLKVAGFDARFNGVGLLVPVGRDRKAAPFRILADARLRVDDFDLVPAGPAHHDAPRTAPPAEAYP